MADDHFWRIVVNVSAVAALAAFWPQIMAFLRKHGYRSMKEQREIDAARAKQDQSK